MSISSTTAAAAVAVAFAGGLALAQLFSSAPAAPVSSEIASPTAPAEAKKEEAAAASAPTLPEVPPGELKMVLVARTDLKMQPGKIAAQCGHATLGAYKRSLKRKPEYVKAWEDRAQAKVVLQVNSEELMDEVAKAAEEAGLVTYIVTDAGRTQIPEGSRTILGIGPAPVGEIDQVTGKTGRFPLKLLY